MFDPESWQRIKEAYIFFILHFHQRFLCMDVCLGFFLYSYFFVGFHQDVFRTYTSPYISTGYVMKQLVHAISCLCCGSISSLV